MGGREVGQPGRSGQWVVLSLEEGARDEGLWCPCLVHRHCVCTGGGGRGGRLLSKGHRLPGTGKAGFALTAISRGDSLLEG